MMSSQEVLEGKITQVLEREPHTTQKGKETTRQLIILSKDGKAIKITCYGMDDMSPYRDVTVRISGLSESFKKDGSYMANYQTEFDDRVESDPTDEHFEDIKEGDMIQKGNINPIPIPSELSKFTVEVKRSKDYQTISLSEEFTGFFAEIDDHWSALDEKAKSLLSRMPKL